MYEEYSIEEMRKRAQFRATLSKNQEERRIEEAQETLTNYFDRAIDSDDELLDKLKRSNPPVSQISLPVNIQERIDFLFQLQDNDLYQSVRLGAFSPSFVKMILGFKDETTVMPYEVGSLSRAFKNLGKPVELVFLPTDDSIFLRQEVSRVIIDHGSPVIARKQEPNNLFRFKTKPVRMVNERIEWDTDDKDELYPRTMILDDMDSATALPPKFFEKFRPPFAATPLENRDLLESSIAPYYASPGEIGLLKIQDVVTELIKRRELLASGDAVKRLLLERGYHWEF